jgi:hypothetical protein
MPCYSDKTTRLTAAQYSWSITVTSGPLHHGSNPAQDCTGTYTTQPGATVGTLLTGLTQWYAQTNGVPTRDVTIVRYSLREK